MHKYTKEQMDFIRDVAPGRYNKEIVDLFNEKFGTNLTESQIKSFKANHGIKSNLARKRRTKPKRLFTEEQEKFIRDNAKGRSNQELTNLVNDKFGLNVTVQQVKNFKHRNKISSGLTGYFEKGNEPANKGKKFPGRVNRTTFKKGQKPHNYKPLGHERVDRNGYVLVKVQDGGPWHKRWKHKHKVVWEQAYGPIPPNHCLIFLDRNKQNITLENLQLVTRDQLARINQNHLISDNPDLTKIGITIAKIHSQIGKRKNS